MFGARTGNYRISLVFAWQSLLSGPPVGDATSRHEGANREADSCGTLQVTDWAKLSQP